MFSAFVLPDSQDKISGKPTDQARANGVRSISHHESRNSHKQTKNCDHSEFICLSKKQDAGDSSEEASTTE